MDKYWKARRRKEEKKAWDIANRSANWQEDFYKQAYKRIETEINALYAEIQSGGKSLDQLTRSELWRYKHYVQLQNVIEQESKTIGGKQLSLMDSTIDNVFRSVMGTELHDSGSSVTLLDNSALRQIKETVWSGESYSDRIWTNTNALAQRTKDKLTDLVAIGKLPEEVKKELQKEFNVSYRVADRLIRTEASHVFNTASIERYEEAGVEQIEVLVEDDDSICDDCLALDGQIFDIDKAPTLPIHPNCRCCYVPVVDRKNEYQKPEPEAEDKLAMVEDYEPPHLTTNSQDVKVLDDDFYIGRSIGAKARNYDIIDKSTGEIYHFAEGQYIQDKKVFAGKGGVKPLEEETIEGLCREYPESKPELWQHSKGKAMIVDDNDEEYRAEVHWFEEPSVGRVKFKVVDWLD